MNIKLRLAAEGWDGAPQILHGGGFAAKVWPVPQREEPMCDSPFMRHRC
jgi:hypothetical protein